MTTKRVVLTVDNNRGYSANQVPTSFTLADLRSLVEVAIDEHGGDAVVVTNDPSNRMAGWGAIDPYADIEASEDEDDGHCDDCEAAGEDECVCGEEE